MNPIAHITDAIAFLGGAIAPRPEPVLPTDIPAHDHRPGASCPRCAYAVAYPMYHAKVALFVAEAEQAAMPPTAIAALARAMVAYSSGYRKPASELLALALGRALRDGGATPEELGLAPATVAASPDLMDMALAIISDTQVPAFASYLAGIAGSPALSQANRKTLFLDHLRGHRQLPQSIIEAIAAKMDRQALIRHLGTVVKSDDVASLPLLRTAGFSDADIWEHAVGTSISITQSLIAGGMSPSTPTPNQAAMGVRPLGDALLIGSYGNAKSIAFASMLIEAGAAFGDAIIPSSSPIHTATRKSTLSQRIAMLPTTTRQTAFLWLARIADGHDDPLPALPDSDRAWLAEQAAAASTSYGMRVLAALSAAAA